MLQILQYISASSDLEFPSLHAHALGSWICWICFQSADQIKIWYSSFVVKIKFLTASHPICRFSFRSSCTGPSTWTSGARWVSLVMDLLLPLYKPVMRSWSLFAVTPSPQVPVQGGKIPVQGGLGATMVEGKFKTDTEDVGSRIYSVQIAALVFLSVCIVAFVCRHGLGGRHCSGSQGCGCYAGSSRYTAPQTIASRAPAAATTLVRSSSPLASDACGSQFKALKDVILPQPSLSFLSSFMTIW